MLAAVVGICGIAPGVSAADYRDTVGSWFGRAVPVAGQTICTAGTPGCAVPKEIIMVFTIHADGTFIGIDSNIFSGGSHSTAHGQWEQKAGDVNSIKATFTLLQSSPQGVFIGGFKNLFEAKVISKDEIEGGINAFLYSYTDSTGAAIVDSTGLPVPSPLGAPSSCITTTGCAYLGAFVFKAKRVTVQ